MASGVAAVYEAMSVRYLEWSYSVGGVKKTRNAYKRYGRVIIIYLQIFISSPNCPFSDKM